MAGAARITLAAGTVLAGAAWLVIHSGVAAEHRNLIGVLPEVLALPLGAIAWRYRRHRLAAIAAMLAAAGMLIRTGLVTWPPQLSTAVLAVVISADIAALAVTDDRPLGSTTGWVWGAVVALQTWLAGWGHHLAPDHVLEHLGWPPLAAIALTTALVGASVAVIVRRGAFEAALLWIAASVTVAFGGPAGAEQAPVFLAAAQLTLLVGAFEDSYRLAFVDELTGLPGRRAFDQALGDLKDRFSIAMVDLDHFKRFNDRHGHDAGDQVLRMVADELRKCGGGGRAHRWGGEEFAIVFPGRSVADIRDDLETLRRSIADRRFALRGPDRPLRRPERPQRRTRSTPRVQVTVSIGIAGSSSRRSSPAQVLKAADRALYRAKGAGRNRVVAAGDRLSKR